MVLINFYYYFNVWTKMRAVVLLAFFALKATAAPFEDGDNDHINGENGWYVPQMNGSSIWMTTKEGEQLLAELEKGKSRNDSNVIQGRLTGCPVNYYLYTRTNQFRAQKIIATDESISKSNFNANNSTRFIIHGWTQNYASSMNDMIRDAWLTHGEHNIIAVDWARARSIDYASSVVAVPKVGKKVAYMVSYLVQNHGMSLDDTQVIGHSLGAHVAGYVGKYVGAGKLQSIVGLDPALPLFRYNKPNKRLNMNDARYVQTIQTCGGRLGFLKPIGMGAFYPNGGRKQPGCGHDLTGACSHERSCVYYAEAVRANDFPSARCSDYEKAVKNGCGGQYNAVKMGALYNNEMLAGKYYVPVHNSAPYGYGS